MDAQTLTTSSEPRAAGPAQVAPSAGPRGGTPELVRLLESPVAPRTSGWIVSTFVLGLLSFGVFPLWRWQYQLRERIINQQLRLRQVAEWLQWKTGRPEARQLASLADQVRWRKGLGTLIALCLLTLACCFIYYFVQISSLSLPSLLKVTYQFGPSHHWKLAHTPASWFFLAWTGCLGVGYLLHAVQLQRHVADMRRFGAGVNQLLSAEAHRPMRLPRLGSGLGIASIVGAAVLLSWGAVWGVVMMLTGSAARRFERGSALRFNRELELMVRALDAGEIDAKLPRTCRKPRCGMILPAAARFCPRCGTRFGGGLNELA